MPSLGYGLSAFIASSGLPLSHAACASSLSTAGMRSFSLCTSAMSSFAGVVISAQDSASAPSSPRR